MNPCPAAHAQRAEPGCSTGPESLTAELVGYLTLHVQAMQEQTAALNRLASSNESLSGAVASLIEEMANAEPEDSDAEPSTYLDGSRVR